VLIYGILAVLGLLMIVLTIFVDSDVDALDSDAPGFFSLRIIGLFIATFGACGLIFAAVSPPGQFVAALIGGIAFTRIGKGAFKYIYKQQSNSLSEVRWQNAEGVVSIAIPEKGIGEIRMGTANGITYEMATANSPIPAGEAVTIVGTNQENIFVVQKNK